MDICFPYCTKFAIIFLELSQHERRGAFCDTERFLNIIWPVTSRGQMAFSRCPVGLRGRIGSKLTSPYYTSLISCFLSRISYFISYISHLTSHISHLTSHISYLVFTILFLVYISELSYPIYLPYIWFLPSPILYLISCTSHLISHLSNFNSHIPYLMSFPIQRNFP